MQNWRAIIGAVRAILTGYPMHAVLHMLNDGLTDASIKHKMSKRQEQYSEQLAGCRYVDVE